MTAPEPPAPPRAIVHLDLDAFFAAVEVLENPELAGQPVIVGGSPSGRGVVSSASYEARRFGVRSAMPTVRALALCPTLVIVSPRHGVYGDYSRRVMALLRQACPLVQPMSIDEAYLDVSDQIGAWEEAVELARRLQARVRDEVGLSASLGVAANKLVAKVASDRDKPGGLTVVPPGQEAAFLAPLPVRVIPGVGPVTARKLADLGVTTAGQLAALEDDDLRTRFGRYGPDLARLARGEDRRRVHTGGEMKSVSHERTFARDIVAVDDLHAHIRSLSESVGRRLRKKGLAASTVAIKVRYSDFTTFTRQMSLAQPTDDGHEIERAAAVLFDRAWQRRRPVRLLGVAARHLAPAPGQLRLWPADGEEA